MKILTFPNIQTYYLKNYYQTMFSCRRAKALKNGSILMLATTTLAAYIHTSTQAKSIHTAL